MESKKVVFYDTETTGLTPGQIGQLSCIIIDGESMQATAKNYWFAVDSVTDSVVSTFGRDVNFYKERSGGKIFADYADEIIDIFHNSIHSAFNIKFDNKFLSAECWRLEKVIVPANMVDMMELWKPIVGVLNANGHLKYPKLEEVIGYLKLDQDKVLALSKRIFADSADDYSYHDSRFDTTCLYIIATIYDELAKGKELKDIKYMQIFGRS